MRAIAVIEGPLFRHGEIHRVRRIELLAGDQEGTDAGVFEPRIFLLKRVSHVMAGTLFGPAEDTSVMALAKMNGS